MKADLVFGLVAEKPGAAPSPSEAPAAAPTKKLDKLFFIEEPKPAHLTESKAPERSMNYIYSDAGCRPLVS